MCIKACSRRQESPAELSSFYYQHTFHYSKPHSLTNFLSSKMVAKLALFLTAFAAVAFAAPGSPAFVSQCNTGNQKCCQSVQDSNSDSLSSVKSLLGLDLSGITGLVGLGCTPFTGAACNAQPVCCDNDEFKGLINVGCTPLSL